MEGIAIEEGVDDTEPDVELTGRSSVNASPTGLLCALLTSVGSDLS